MRRQRLTIIIIALCAMLIIAVNYVEAAAQLSNQYRLYLKSGVEKAFNLDFVNANANLQQAIEMDPENPTAYAYLSMVNSFAYEMNFDENVRKNYQDSILRNVDAALTRGEKKIAQNPQDNQAYFAMAMAKTSKLEWAIHQKNYLTVAKEASATWEYLEKAKENDPQNFDIYFLLGTFHYHIDHLPGLTRFLSALIITSGDSQKGLQELELAAQKGDLLKQLAMSELSSNYLNFERQPSRALPLIRELKNKFPNNYNFLFGLGNTLSDLGKFDDALNLAREIENKIKSGIPPFVSQLQPRSDLLMGRILFAQGDYARAEGYLQKALQVKAAYNARVRAWAFVRLGMISDIRQDREKAKDYYSRALDVKNGEGTAQIEAKKYLETSYIPPPKNGSGK